jgi:hypothetical protein
VRVHFRLLTGELRALDLHESERNTIEQPDAHAALMQELSTTARAHLSDALERAGRAEAEVLFTAAATRHGMFSTPAGSQQRPRGAQLRTRRASVAARGA